jgi:hypothetical protein
MKQYIHPDEPDSMDDEESEDWAYIRVSRLRTHLVKILEITWQHWRSIWADSRCPAAFVYERWMVVCSLLVALS